MIHFVGAGPGAVDLITVRGQRLIEKTDVLIYAGSLVSDDFSDLLKPGASLYNSAYMTLEQVCEIFLKSDEMGLDLVRLHTGDPSLFGAIAEQQAFLKKNHIPYDITPGVTAAFAAAAALGIEYTLPGISQTLILTRAKGRTPVPDRETIEALSATGSSMAIYLSVKNAAEVKEALLLGGYKETTPAAIVYRASWPDQRVIRTRVAELDRAQQESGIEKTALLIVGDALLQSDFDRSCLYDPDFSTEYRK